MEKKKKLEMENKHLKKELEVERNKTAGKCIDVNGHKINVPKGSFLDGVTFELDEYGY